MVEVPIEVIMHFPEKTQHIKGFLRKLDLHNDHMVNEVSWGRDIVTRVNTGFTLQGVIGNWENKDGRRATPPKTRQADRARARRLARRERARDRRRSGAQA